MSNFKRGHALVVGVAAYPNVRKLPDAVLNDASDFAALLQDPLRCGYPPDQVRLICDERATKTAIVEGLQWLAERTTEEDTALFFFSGHGGRTLTTAGVESFLLAYDAGQDRNGGGLLGGAELTALLRKVRASRFGLFFDSCFASGVAEIKKGQTSFKSGLHESFYNELLSSGHGRAILAACRQSEESLILREMPRNSLFTHFLLEAFRGEAPRMDEGTVGIVDVYRYVYQQVLARDSRQHPVLEGKTENFPIALAPQACLASPSTVPPMLLREPRKGQDRRKVERRRHERRDIRPIGAWHPLDRRMRYGLWQAFHEAFGIGKFEPPPLGEHNRDKAFRALAKEAERYEYKEGGIPCAPDKVLKAIVPRFWPRIEDMSPYGIREMHAINVIDDIARTILREYEVTMKENRRLEERRTNDRRQEAPITAAPAKTASRR